MSFASFVETTRSEIGRRACFWISLPSHTDGPEVNATSRTRCSSLSAMAKSSEGSAFSSMLFAIREDRTLHSSAPSLPYPAASSLRCDQTAWICALR